jgi:hypothetical protein
MWLFGHKPRVSDIKYAIKCVFKAHGMVVYTLLVLLATIQLSIISMTVSEESLATQVYQSVITMNVVGYGELVPDGGYERFIMIVASIIGSFASPILTVTFLQSFKLNVQEQKAK